LHPYFFTTTGNLKKLTFPKSSAVARTYELLLLAHAFTSEPSANSGQIYYTGHPNTQVQLNHSTFFTELEETFLLPSTLTNFSSYA